MDIPLGRPTTVPEHYDPSLLASMDRAPARAGMGVGARLPFVGEDVWHGYEFSWLSLRGLPQVAGLRLRVNAESPRIVESKSMKLYLNGFAQARFVSAQEVCRALERDLADACGAAVSVDVTTLAQLAAATGDLPGDCLDTLDIEIDQYERAPDLLAFENSGVVEQVLHTHLFRSLCPVTAQPDWASVLIRYRGPAIHRPGLLKYLVSFRRHQAFHENTVEQIFLDLKERCRCERLLVGGYFLRRGGIDINPFRGDPGERWPVVRLARQ